MPQALALLVQALQVLLGPQELLALARGDAAEAVAALGRARRYWSEFGAPYLVTFTSAEGDVADLVPVTYNLSGVDQGSKRVRKSQL